MVIETKLLRDIQQEKKAFGLRIAMAHSFLLMN
jgi:hypothetical protein